MLYIIVLVAFAAATGVALVMYGIVTRDRAVAIAEIGPSATPVAAAKATRTMMYSIGQGVVKCHFLLTSSGPTPPAEAMVGHAGSGVVGVVP